MPTTDLSVLVTADLHLGRHPARVPEAVDGRQFSPAAVWRATVEEAIARDVDAVLVAGDVVDRENRYVEAYGDFERGATRLSAADVPVLAVAGNHDHDALPAVIDSVDCEGVDLLGAEGRWERRRLFRDGDPVLAVDGWSFPSEHVLGNPLDAYDPEALVGKPGPDDAEEGAADAPVPAPAGGTPGRTATLDVPVVGLLHADLDARDSRYAPVSTADLRDEAADAWVLGHVHAPGVRVEADPLVCYPGSPQPLDPGEPGAHGPWLLSIEGAGGHSSGRASIRTEQLPLATLRYDEVVVDASPDPAAADAASEDARSPDATSSAGDAARATTSTGVTATTDVAPAVRTRLEAHLRADVTTDHLELLLARVRLTGRTEVHAELADERAAIEEQLRLRRDGLLVDVDRLALDTRPAVDLESRAGGDTPVAYLAELLLALEDDAGGIGGPRDYGTREDGELVEGRTTLDGDHAALIDDALDRLREAHGASAYTRLHREDRIDQPDRADAVETVTRQARLLLDALLEQREGPT